MAEFVVRETHVEWGKNKNISFSPTIVPTDDNHPFSVLNQSKSKVKIRITDSTNKNATKLLDFNISIDYHSILFEIAVEALKNKTLMWEMSEEKIFGEADQNGYMIDYKIRIIRNPQYTYPWYIEIDNGKAIGVDGANGTKYAKKGSFISEKKASINISDEAMYKLCYWTDVCIKNFFTGAGPRMLKAWNKIVKEDAERNKNRSNQNQGQNNGGYQPYQQQAPAYYPQNNNQYNQVPQQYPNNYYH